MSIVKAEIVHRSGHPWDGSQRPNFDMMYVDATSRLSLDKALDKAKQFHWKSWMSGETADAGLFCAVLFKPSGIATDWDDGPKNPHPGNNQVTDDSEAEAIRSIV